MDNKTLEAIFRDAIDGIIIIDDKGIIEALNPSAATLFGYEESEVVGKNVKVLMPSPYREEHDGYIENYHRTGEKRIIGIGREVTGLRKNGTTFPFRLSISEVHTAERKFYTGFIHDISDLKAAEEKLQQMNAYLEELVEERTEELSDVVNKLLKSNRQLEYEMKERQAAVKELEMREQEITVAYQKEKDLGRLKSRFISIASHEFRTPLTTIASSAALISKYTKTEDQAKREKHINRIKSNVQHLTGILNDFLSLSRLEEGKVEVKLEEFIWQEYCLEVIDELGGILKKDQKIQPILPTHAIRVLLDKRLVKHIVFNLLSNAIKYSPENTRIVYKTTLENGYLRIEIIDQGIGIPEQEQQHLFTRFFRATNVENIKGTGLGLTIVKRYLNLLGGKIDFKSIQNRGTTFYVWLPLQVASKNKTYTSLG